MKWGSLSRNADEGQKFDDIVHHLHNSSNIKSGAPNIHFPPKGAEATGSSEVQHGAEDTLRKQQGTQAGTTVEASHENEVGGDRLSLGASPVVSRNRSEITMTATPAG